ncbi:MAG TPA: enoyl-CoA hydratase [Stellaceae bacterium]|nr:enoyl-CoA hydratase [Stellaceae bacterium]
MDTGSQLLLARKEGPIGWIVLNNPARHNAVSLEMWRALLRLMPMISADTEIRAVIVTGAGERAFSAGADISEFEDLRATPEAVSEYDGIAEQACQALEHLPRPTIAMIRGYCIGGGLDLALRCDLRLASTDARFGIPAARLGLGYAFSDVRRLVQLAGPAAAKELFYSGRQFSAGEALEMHIVNRVTEPAQLERSVRELAESIAGNAPLTIVAAKRCVIEALRDASDADIEACQAMVDRCFASADYVEGRRAFMEKRRPVFRGI